MIAIKQELDAVTAATLETKGYFIQKLVQTDRELATVKKELAVIKTDVIKSSGTEADQVREGDGLPSWPLHSMMQRQDGKADEREFR